MLALLYATYIIKGLWEYSEVPTLIKNDVKNILIAEGLEVLITD